MSIPLQVPPAPNRTVLNYTVGTGAQMPLVTEGVVDGVFTSNPGVNGIGSINLGLIWADYGTLTVHVPAITGGATATIVGQIPLPEVPPQNILPGRGLAFIVSGGFTTNLTGIVLQGVLPQGVVSSGDLQLFTGVTPYFTGGTTYTGFVMQVTVVLYAVVSTAGGAGTFWATGLLTNESGGT